MKNIDVIISFILNLKPIRTQNVWTSDMNTELFSYDTCIAQFTIDKLYINMTYYNIYTSRIRNMVIHEALKYIAEENIIYVNDIPKGSDKLIN